MPHFRVAHLREQGQNMIVVPLDASFGNRPSSDQDATISELQMRAHGAGLASTVVPVWESGGRMSFIAPPPWHPFFKSLSMPSVVRNLNKELYW